MKSTAIPFACACALFVSATAAAEHAPIAISPSDMENDSLDYKTVTISGSVTDVFQDEINPLWTFLFVEKDGARAIVPLCAKTSLPAEELAPLLDAEISATGMFHTSNSSGRKFLGPCVKVYGRNNVVITKPAPADPFALPEVTALTANRISDILRSGHRCKVSGTVLAAWDRDTFLLAMANGQKLRVHLASGTVAPGTGDALEVCGFLKATPFFLHLSKALCRKAAVRGRIPETVTDIVPGEVLTNRQGKPEIKVDFDGRAVRLAGRTVETLVSPAGESTTTLDCDGERVKVVTTGLPSPAPGSVVEVTGIFVLTESAENGGIEFPRLTGFMLVTRNPGDIRVVRSAPWWSPGRFLAVISVLAVLLASALVWNRTLNREAERRSRELLRKTADAENAESRRSDRTRLAIELHDALSQNLTAVALQISSARNARARRDAETEGRHLDTAEKMLDSSRTELKNCLYDLRSDMLEERDFEAAVRKAIGNALGNARVEISFAIRRSRLDDITAHTVLMVLRELVSNAVRHGKAGAVAIEGTLEGDVLRFDVTDDGTGFSPEDAPGIDKGHFGIEGIRQRIGQLGGDVAFASATGKGTTVTISFPLPPATRPHSRLDGPECRT